MQIKSVEHIIEDKRLRSLEHLKPMSENSVKRLRGTMVGKAEEDRGTLRKK